MNVLLFGATGIVGDSVLHERLADPRVTSVLAVVRRTRRVAPAHVTTAESVDRAMVAVAVHGYPRRVLENPDINRLGIGHSAV